MRSGGRPAAALLLAVALAVTPAAAAKDPAKLRGKWVEARSDHFVLVGNVSEKTAVRTLQGFERMRELVRGVNPAASDLDDPPLLVFAAKDVKSFVTFLPSLRGVPGRQLLAGIFYDHATLPFVIVRTDYTKAQDLAVVFHEYYHYLVGRLGVDLPPWLSEGLADFWGAAVFTDDATEIGRPQDERLFVVRNLELIPLERFFAVQPFDPEFRRADSLLLFYSQSWLVVHYLTIGVHGDERANQMTRYLNLLAAGESSLDAARAAFGDLSTLEGELEEYLERRRLPIATYPATRAPSVDSARVRRISRAEAAAWLGLGLLHVETVENAEPWVVAARDGAPEQLETQLAVALLAFRRGRWSEARTSFDRAASRPDATALAAYGAGVSRLRGPAEGPELAEAERQLLRAMELDRLYAPAYAALAEHYRRIDPDLRRALYLQSRAAEIRSHQEAYQVDRIALLFADERDDEASRELTLRIDRAAESEDMADLIVLCWRGALRGLTKRVLPACDHAVEFAPGEARAVVLDRRGLVRALAGDLEGALADLREALAEGGEIWSEEMAAKRRRWIERLETGRNPFAGDGLAALLEDPEENPDWGL